MLNHTSGTIRGVAKVYNKFAYLDERREIAHRLASRPPESVAAIKRLVRNATETPLAQGLALERNLFLKLCISDAGLARMRSYEAATITSPARSIEVNETEVNRG